MNGPRAGLGECVSDVAGTCEIVADDAYLNSS